MSRKLTVLITLMLIFSILNGLILASPILHEVTTFSDDTSEKTVPVPSGAGSDPAFELPKKAIVTSASFNVSTKFGESNYPDNAYIDVGSDGDFEWAFTGKGYGGFGKQYTFSDDNNGQALYFDGNITFNNQSSIYLPKNATVSSATMDARGGGAGNVILVKDGSNPYGLTLMKTALESVGNKVTLVKESGLTSISNWSSPSSYKAIFWVGGTSSSNGPSNSLLKSFVKYVQGGGNVFMCGQWIDYTGSYSGNDEIPFFTWVLHNTWGNRWNGGGSGNGGKHYTHQSNTSHPVFNSPNTLPNVWNNTYTGTFWHTTSATINNGSIIGKAATSSTSAKHTCIVAWDGPTYNVAYGKTIMVRQPIAQSWFNITEGDVLTNFTQNVATWFMGIGGISNVTIDIGSNGGTPEFNHSGLLDDVEHLPDFTDELNNIISAQPVAFTDDYGIEFVEIPINGTSDEMGMLMMSNLDIRYNLTTTAFLNPHNFNLVNELNELVPDTGEGNITIPIRPSSTSAGKLHIRNISIEYYVPELTNDRLLITNANGVNNICYSDYMDYTFIVNITNKQGTADVRNTTLILDADGESIELLWTRAGDVFSEKYDPKNLVELKVPNCQSTTLDAERWSLQFSVRFTWNYASEDLELCALNITNNSFAFDLDFFPNVYRVENDLDLIGALEVLSQFQGILKEGGTNNWVRASEQITWSNLTAVYEGTSNFYPDNKNFNITIYDDDAGIWVNSTSSGSVFSITTTSDPTSDYFDRHYINITDIPGVGTDVSNWNFMVKTDNDGPLTPPSLLCHADTPVDPETQVDDDSEIYVSWGSTSDSGGSGVLEHAMEYNNNLPTSIKISGDSATGIEGLSTFYVRARDKVGNWGTTGSASIFIDLSDITYSEPIPEPNIWHNTKTVEVGIIIRDTEGSGVDSGTIKYRYVEDGNVESGSWHDYTGASTSELIICRENITFLEDGEQKKVQWRAFDMAGNGYILSNVYTLKIDSTPVTFEGFSLDFDQWYDTASPQIDFLVNDTNPFGGEASGVDVSSIMYSYTTTGKANYGSWVALAPTGSGSSVKCTVQPTFAEGEDNYIRFSGRDMAGNDIISSDYQLKIDLSTPEFSNPTPTTSTWNNEMVLQCNITIFDEYSKADVKTLKYSVSTNGTDHYSNWRIVSTKHLNEFHHRTITMNINETFKEGTANYIRWRVTDTAGNTKFSDDYQIQIDITGCTFHDAKPTTNDWWNSLEVPCSIIINDTDGAGVDLESIEYYAYSGRSEPPVSSWNWKTKDIDITDISSTWEVGTRSGTRNDEPTIQSSVFAEVSVNIFNEGVYNFIYWRVKDVAQNGYTQAGPFRVQIDRTGVAFSNPKPTPESMLLELEQPCQITIKDNGGSNVDLDSVEVRYSTEGEGGYTDWNSTGISSNKKGNSYVFLIYLGFNYGEANLIQWRAKDNAGNGPFESEEYNLLINSPPVVKITNPKSTSAYFESGLVTFDGKKSYDPDFGDMLSFYWHSNVSGGVGYKDYFRSTLLPGHHMITLWVTDDYSHNVSKHINITIKWFDLDSDGIPDKDDPDDDNDGYPDTEDAFPEDEDEWLDTDFDGIGNRADPDDDNDGHPDSEDDYPTDKDRWKKEEESVTEELLLPLIILVVIIILVVLVLFAYFRSKRKKEQEQAKGAEGQLSTGTGAPEISVSYAPTVQVQPTPLTMPTIPTPMTPIPTTPTMVPPQSMYMQMPPIPGQQLPMLPPPMPMMPGPSPMPAPPPVPAPAPVPAPMPMPMQPQPQPMQPQPQHQQQPQQYQPQPQQIQQPQPMQPQEIPQAPVGEIVQDEVGPTSNSDTDAGRQNKINNEQGESE